MINAMIKISILRYDFVMYCISNYSTQLARVARASAVLVLKKHERLGIIFLPIPETISPLQESQK